MRIRRKPWARPELAACDFFISVEDAPKHKGKWNAAFLKKNPIHLELGCGKGQFISKIAFENEDINYIGVDIKSEHRFVESVSKRMLIKDTDIGKKLKKQIYYLEMLLYAYKTGYIKNQGDS